MLLVFSACVLVVAGQDNGAQFANEDKAVGG
jgi:hypothetical protein